MSLYLTLLACGLFLVGLEIFIPGGILGVIGGAALIGAAVIGFQIFPIWGGWLSLLSILALTGVALYAWMRFIPQSPIGRALSLPGAAQNKASAQTSKWTVGMTGTTLCELRPSGKALIQEQRADVIADHGTWINTETAIEIVNVSGNRIYVKELHADA